MNPHDPNLPMLEAVVQAFGGLANRFVFVGGCTTGLWVTDPAAAPVRATKDVDVIIEVMTLVDYHTLERELMAAGFTQDRTPDAPICRWVVAGCLVDIMPTNEQILETDGSTRPSNPPNQYVCPEDRKFGSSHLHCSWLPNLKRSKLVVPGTFWRATIWKTSSPSWTDGLTSQPTY